MKHTCGVHKKIHGKNKKRGTKGRLCVKIKVLLDFEKERRCCGMENSERIDFGDNFNKEGIIKKNQPQT
jgi:hypothetical protein